ncbi:hypothetical protein BOSE46_80183 [Bosea sp. 46]|nr:hypothetical protein BOSE46_80183 [Bosea sp. 46]
MSPRFYQALVIRSKHTGTSSLPKKAIRAFSSEVGTGSHEENALTLRREPHQHRKLPHPVILEQCDMPAITGEAIGQHGHGIGIEQMRLTFVGVG